MILRSDWDMVNLSNLTNTIPHFALRALGLFVKKEAVEEIQAAIDAMLDSIAYREDVEEMD